jgi:hypothetical protein
MKNNYKQPAYSEKNFNCPNCGVLAFQNWDSTYRDTRASISNLHVASCQNCKRLSIWYEQKMVHPKKLTAPLAHEDMPNSVQVIYNEARNVAPDSARAAAALLRVALEKLTEELGETEGNLNTRIGNLKSKGLPQKVIQSLDVVRIFANEGGSHAGEIDLSGKDNEEIVIKLFKLINFIVEKTITENNEIEAMYGTIPDNKRDGIDNRDK